MIASDMLVDSISKRHLKNISCRLATTDMGRKLGAVLLFWGNGSVMLVLGLGLVLKESLRTIFMSLALALALELKSLALALQQVLVPVLECIFRR